MACVLRSTQLFANFSENRGGPNESEEVRSGRFVVPPSTYIGGERYMPQKMHDIIANSNKMGTPDIFLTMICNPNWPEI